MGCFFSSFSSPLVQPFCLAWLVGYFTLVIFFLLSPWLSPTRLSLSPSPSLSLPLPLSPFLSTQAVIHNVAVTLRSYIGHASTLDSGLVAVQVGWVYQCAVAASSLRVRRRHRRRCRCLKWNEGATVCLFVNEYGFAGVIARPCVPESCARMRACATLRLVARAWRPSMQML
jgi:hypothetical protein